MSVTRARSDESESTDGRVQRSLRSRQQIADALAELVEGGELMPTAEQVALRAGVGLRTVFRHFQDMETLYAEVSARIQGSFRELVQDEVSGTVAERVRRLVGQRAGLFEAVAPFKRSEALRRWSSPYLRQSHAEMVRDLRQHLKRGLPEMDAVSGDRQAALELLSSFEAWDRLRHQQGLSRERAEALVSEAVLTLLG